MHPILRSSSRQHVCGQLSNRAEEVEKLVWLLGSTIHAFSIMKLADEFDATWNDREDFKEFTGRIRAAVHSAARVAYTGNSVFEWLANPVNGHGLVDIIAILLHDLHDNTGILLRQECHDLPGSASALRRLLKAQGHPYKVTVVV